MKNNQLISTIFKRYSGRTLIEQAALMRLAELSTISDDGSSFSVVVGLNHLAKVFCMDSNNVIGVINELARNKLIELDRPFNSRPSENILYCHSSLKDKGIPLRGASLLESNVWVDKEVERLRNILVR